MSEMGEKYDNAAFLCGESSEERIVEKQMEKATGADADVDFSKYGMKVTGKTGRSIYSQTRLTIDKLVKSKTDG
jgi:hypothetical protein